MSGRSLRARETIAPAGETAFAGTPPAASALARLRSKLARPLDPQDPLSSLVPLIDSLRSAGEIETAALEAPLTTFPALDELLGGGLPRGKLVEMIGARSSGRFSAVLAALAAATTAGEAAALVDLGDGLDPQAAAALGLDLRRLLWLRPATLKQALAGAEMVLGGGFPLVVLDLGSPPVRGGRGVEAGWLRLARAAQTQRAALLVASPYRATGTAAAMVLQAARGRARWHGMGGPPWLLDGLSCQVTLEKCRGRLLPAGALGLELQLSPIALTAPAAPGDPAATAGSPPSLASLGPPRQATGGRAAPAILPDPAVRAAAAPAGILAAAGGDPGVAGYAAEPISRRSRPLGRRQARRP